MLPGRRATPSLGKEQLEDGSVAVWPKLRERKPAQVLAPSQGHTSWLGKAWMPAATQAGHPVVPQASKQAHQVWLGGAGSQDNSGK